MTKTKNQVVKTSAMQDAFEFKKRHYWRMRLFKCIHIIVLIIAFCFSSIGSAYGENEKTPIIEFGILPYLNPTSLFTLWDPMRLHLEKKLKYKISFQTAKDYKTFVQRSHKGRYNYLITASHFARLHQRDSGFQSILAPKSKLYGIFVVKENSPIQLLADLKRKTIATPDSLAVITLGGIETLRKLGISADDIFTRSFSSHNSAIMSVQSNQYEAGICSVKAFNVMRENTKINLRLLGKTDQIPYPIVFMAHPTEDTQKVQKIRDVLMDFFINTEEGLQLVQKKGYKEMISPVESDFDFFDPMLPKLRKLIYEETN